ncbi:MAG TPA: hypothetical protein VFN56_03455 [Candidatus Saccharimonadales bacterium]|nr:hypothetical protein [Candidatus Saccharimonadales bacterium]
MAASYSAEVNYETGLVNPEYQAWLEDTLTRLEHFGHNVFCALRVDQYKINNAGPAEAFRLDEEEIEKAYGLFAIVTDRPSTGVQTEIGIAIRAGKTIIIAHLPQHPLAYFNNAIIRAGKATELVLPITEDPFAI